MGEAPSVASDARTPDELVGRLFEASVGMFDVMSVHLGDRLGLYRVLHEQGPATPGELAARAAIDVRYAREWLEQQAVTGILDVDRVDVPAAERRYQLPDAYVDPLINRDSPWSIAPLGRSVVACALAVPQLIQAFHSGGGVDWSAYGPDMIEAQGDFNRPWLVNSFGSEILPSIPQIHELLVADPPALVADVACGVGWAAIAIARAYPNVRVDGFDLDPLSIELAAENAQAAGLSDRVSFRVRDAADPATTGRYDLAVIVEAVHDMAHPVEVLAAVRQMLRPNGSLLVADEKTGDAFTAPAGELERMFYGFSVFSCLPGAMGERPTAATGTVIRASTMQDYAAKAGFRGFERLDEPALETLRFYRVTP
jgi:2-polyprenyl-3-methyl-5-hydroxy-6-metoxy-1,4-benzoquinol methylase